MSASSFPVVVAAAWEDRCVEGVSDEVVLEAWALAGRHLVRGWIARAYAERLPIAYASAARVGLERWASNLEQVAQILRSAHVTAVLIRSGLENRAEDDDRPIAAAEYGDADLVVGCDGWARALLALQPWGRAEPATWLEPHKVMVRPGLGPPAHVHRDAEWFGVPAVGLHALRVNALALANGLLLPSRTTAIVLLIGHAVFQTLELNLSDLLELRRLGAARDATDAAAEAARSGWGAAFRFAWERASAAIANLDEGKIPSLPVSLGGGRSLVNGWRHATHLAWSGRPVMALREVVLRPCLVAAKSRRQWSAREEVMPLIAASGAGSTTPEE